MQQQQQYQQKVQIQANPYTTVNFQQLQVNEKMIGEYKFGLQSVIGEGEFSKVYLGQNINTSEQVAIKVIDKQKILSNNVYKQLLDNEISILQQVDLKSILKLHSIQHTSNNIYIVTEYCCDGDLQEIIQKTNHIPEHNALRILKHLIKALLYLQQHNIIHRDIKSSNILVSNQVPKIADFGFAIDQSKQQHEKFLQIGTPLYMAPEIFYNCQYSFKTDIWAMGCVFYEMLFGQTPFPAKTREELDFMFKKHQQGQWLQFETPITQQAKDFIINVLKYDQRDRYDINEAANHPLIQQTHPHAKK